MPTESRKDEEDESLSREELEKLLEHLVRNKALAAGQVDLMTFLIRREHPPNCYEIGRRQLPPKQLSEEERNRAGNKGRADMIRLRQSLKVFATSEEGRQLPYRFQIPLGDYTLGVKAQDAGAKKMVAPLFSAPVDFIYTEPLLFSVPNKRVLLRHLDANDESDPGPLTRSLPGLKPIKSRLVPCRQFVSSGEAACMLGLTQVLERAGVYTSAYSIEASRAEDMSTNKILLGNWRTNWLLAEHEDKLPIRTTDNGIKIIKRPGHLVGARGPFEDNVADGGYSFGLISRRCFGKDRWALLLSAHNSGAFHGIATVFSSAKGVSRCLSDIARLNRSREIPSEFPPQFQFVLRFPMRRDEETALPRVVTYWEGPPQ